MSAVLAAQRSGEGQVVDAAMVDGAALAHDDDLELFAPSGSGRTSGGPTCSTPGAPFYEVYECADGRHVAVGALEPEFYAALLEVMGL